MKHRLLFFAQSQDSKQFIKFAVVGCLNVLVSFLVFYLCYRQWPLAALILQSVATIHPSIESTISAYGVHAIDAAFANTIGYLAGMINSFVLNKLWTFEAKGTTIRQIHRFFILNILGLAVSTLIIFVFVDHLGAPYLIVWFFTIALVMILNFLGNKHWTFAEKSQLENAS